MSQVLISSLSSALPLLELQRYDMPLFDTKLNRPVAFKEMTFTGRVPKTGTAGAQGNALLNELKVIGVLPFLKVETYEPTKIESYEIAEVAHG